MARYLALLIALSLALLAPTSASAEWLPIEEVGTIQPSDQELRVASNDRGDSVILWRTDEGLRVSISQRGGEFGGALEVPGSKGANAADVILNEDGRAIVHWRKFVAESRLRVELVGLKVDGGLFGKPRAVTPAAEYITFEPVIGPNGRFTIVYTTNQRFRPVYARVAPPSGKLGRRITLASGSIRGHELWYLGNRPMIAYTQASDTYSRLRERQIGSGGSRVIANMPKNSTVLIDTASNGQQAAAWINGFSGDTKQPLFVATRRAGRSFGSGQVIDKRVPPQEIDIAIARSGHAILAWRQWNEPTTEDGGSATPELTPGYIVTSYRFPGSQFNGMTAFRADESERVVEDLTADINSEGLGVLGWSGGRFQGAERRLYTARIYRSDNAEVTPMTGYANALFRIHRVTVDERSRTAFGWIYDTTVFARRGSWGINQP